MFGASFCRCIPPVITLAPSATQFVLTIKPAYHKQLNAAHRAVCYKYLLSGCDVTATCCSSQLVCTDVTGRFGDDIHRPSLLAVGNRHQALESSKTFHCHQYQNTTNRTAEQLERNTVIAYFWGGSVQIRRTHAGGRRLGHQSVTSVEGSLETGRNVWRRSELIWTDLIWTDLNWIELIWTDLNWTVCTELIWTELNWTDLKWIELNWSELNWNVCTELMWTDLNWTDLNWSGLIWTDLNCTDLNWTDLYWTDLNWSQLNWTELIWT